MIFLQRISGLIILIAGLVLGVAASADESAFQKDTGYRGIWYYNQKTNDEYVYKYSGGLGTYCAKHIPTADPSFLTKFF